MSVAYFIVIKPEIEGFDPFVNGKAIAKVNEKALTKLCNSLKVRPLVEFVSQNPDDLAAFLESEGVDDPGEIPQEQWFSADDGLTTVRALKQHLAENPDALKNAAAIVEDLDEYENVLDRVKKENVKWHLDVDF